MTIAGSRLDALLLLAGIVLTGASGLPGFVMRPSRTGYGGQRFAAALTVLGSALGIAAAVRVLAGPGAFRISLAGPLPGVDVVLAADALSAAFLLPSFAISALGAVYGLGYWPAREKARSARRLGLSWGVLTASMAAVTIARTGVVFLVAWELMALAAFFAATSEDEEAPVREAGWVYLVATHAGTLCLFGMVALLASRAGSFLWERLPPGSGHGGADTAIFVLALVGFGFKAGLFPLHFWLPAAHANAPSHVSALMSGAMLKLGIYGILRITSLFEAPPFGWGAALLVVGAVTAVYGIALGVSQSDLKRLLAYSSIENVGVIALGIGLALLGRATGHAEWIALGLAGAVLHVWNHASFKGLLFFSAGAVIHASGTRDVEKLGGLLKRMPRTGLAFLLAALAVSALPPLNGFASELLIYLGLLSGWNAASEAAPLLGFAIPALALVGGLAVAGFVKAFGIVFLGEARSPFAASAHEAGPLLLLPMAVLAVPCLLAAALLPLFAPALDAVTSAWNGAPSPPLASAAPLVWLPLSWLLVAALAAALALVVHERVGRAPAGGPTWDCGYARPTARMQYTGASFAEWLGERLLPRSLRRGAETRVPRGLFPAEARFALEAARDPVSRRVYEPFLERWAERFAALRLLQQGRLPVYLVYVFITMLTLLAWAALRGWPRTLG